MAITPTSLERTGASGLRVQWSDGTTTEYTAALLRKSCPCATCREKHGAKDSGAKESGGADGQSNAGKSLALPVLSMAEAQPLSIRAMRPVGNYAYNIAFSDGHDSGIYTFDYLLSVGQPVK